MQKRQPKNNLPKLQPMNEGRLGAGTFDELVNLSNRLYCAWQCALNGDALMVDHERIIGAELYEIWSLMVDVLDNERECLRSVEEEMRKFQQGFAYRPKDDMQGMID